MNINDVTSYLTEAEIPFEKMDYFYPKHDARVWTLRILPQTKNIFLFCKVNHLEYQSVTYDILHSGSSIMGMAEEFLFDRLEQLLGTQYYGQ